MKSLNIQIQPQMSDCIRKQDNSVDFGRIINLKAYEVHALAKSKVFYESDHERIIITVFLDISNMVMLKKL